jgi:triphosphoribosyl-dephospho-CoA synthase
MTSNPADTQQLSDCLAEMFRSACIAELEALKPGNVHIYADGHGMQVQDFTRSAAAAASKISQPGLCVGERIEQAVDASWQAVGCNTNLGIILLGAPLIHAAFHGAENTLRNRLHKVLATLTMQDAEHTFRAILRASPAGLGGSSRHDVHRRPTVTLLEAMREASQRDRIAFQYDSDFADVFEIGVPCFDEAIGLWGDPSWAATAVYLGFLARYSDTHIERKYGVEIARTICDEAAVHEAALLVCDNPQSCLSDLLEFDRTLKMRGLNPGTSADLTVATLLVVSMENVCNDSAVFSITKL